MRARKQSQSLQASGTVARSNLNASAAKGITLIEVLVTLGIVSILAALILPAVFQGLETARKAQCQGNLRQIGLAVTQYTTTYQCMPMSLLINKSPLPHNRSYFSIHTRLLPYIERATEFNAINFDVVLQPPQTPGRSKPGGPSDAMNATVYGTQITQFLCPSDSGPFAATGNNYRGNTGVGPFSATVLECPDSGNGLFPELGVITIPRIVDGLSHTVAFSERLRGSGWLPKGVPQRDLYQTWVQGRDADTSLVACSIVARPGKQIGYVTSGHSWFWTGRERTLYNHAQVPNGKVVDCFYGVMIPSAGMITARSNHFGGVNIVMADGSTRFTSNSIVLQVWRGLGTRNMGELVD